MMLTQMTMMIFSQTMTRRSEEQEKSLLMMIQMMMITIIQMMTRKSRETSERDMMLMMKNVTQSMMLKKVFTNHAIQSMMFRESSETRTTISLTTMMIYSTTMMIFSTMILSMIERSKERDALLITQTMMMMINIQMMTEFETIYKLIVIEALTFQYIRVISLSLTLPKSILSLI